MPSSQVDVNTLLDLIEHAKVREVVKPWGREVIIDTGAFLLKFITVSEGHRTSLQYHERKDEVTIVIYQGLGGERELEGTFIDHSGPVRVRPGQRHRVQGFTQLIELTTMDDDDVVRVDDDYGRKESL